MIARGFVVYIALCLLLSTTCLAYSIAGDSKGDDETYEPNAKYYDYNYTQYDDNDTYYELNDRPTYDDLNDTFYDGDVMGNDIEAAKYMSLHYRREDKYLNFLEVVENCLGTLSLEELERCNLPDEAAYDTALPETCKCLIRCTMLGMELIDKNNSIVKDTLSEMMQLYPPLTQVIDVSVLFQEITACEKKPSKETDCGRPLETLRCVMDTTELSLTGFKNAEFVYGGDYGGPTFYTEQQLQDGGVEDSGGYADALNIPVAGFDVNIGRIEVDVNYGAGGIDLNDTIAVDLETRSTSSGL